MLTKRKEALSEGQKAAMKDLERIIAEKSPHEAPVTVENDVDDDFPPTDFVYIGANIVSRLETYNLRQ